MLKVRANTVTSDKALLARAQAEIAKLKLLLKHALEKAEAGGAVSAGDSEWQQVLCDWLRADWLMADG